MVIKVRTKIYVNDKEVLVKDAVKKYKKLAGFIKDFRRTAKSVACLSDNGIMTASQEFKYSGGDIVKVEIHTREAAA